MTPVALALVGVVLGLVAAVALMRGRGVETRPDPPAIRTIARFTFAASDPAPLLDLLVAMLRRDGVEATDWRWRRDGAAFDCGAATERFQLELTMFGETTLRLSGVHDGLAFGPPEDSELTRRVLRAVDAALRHAPTVRALRWRRREVDAARGPGQFDAPFDA